MRWDNNGKKCMSPRLILRLAAIIIVFVSLVITMLLMVIIVVFLAHLGIFPTMKEAAIIYPLVIIGIVSVIVGTIITSIMSIIPLKPMNTLINGMNALAQGDYTVRIPERGGAVTRRVAESFNTLADELKNTELLRSDFVNNFSHEFKTPIVSIRGFAKLLQKGQLSSEEQTEYLGIIVDESTRLADMATNVLELTKVENQAILTDVTTYNLSEQIRTCILLLEKKWAQKELEINAVFDEYRISANEELLKQVWINLLDNAIKFSPAGAVLDVGIFNGVTVSDHGKTQLTVEISNDGDPISEEDQKRIFQKFYQAETSHASEGTGIGLAVVKRIVQLHNAQIFVESKDHRTTFCVVFTFNLD